MVNTDNLPTFSDEDVEHLGELFVNSGVHESYGVTFAEYLNALAPNLAHMLG
jgi:hypothetical protein